MSSVSGSAEASMSSDEPLAEDSDEPFWPQRYTKMIGDTIKTVRAKVRHYFSRVTTQCTVLIERF